MRTTDTDAASEFTGLSVSALKVRRLRGKPPRWINDTGNIRYRVDDLDRLLEAEGKLDHAAELERHAADILASTVSKPLENAELEKGARNAAELLVEAGDRELAAKLRSVEKWTTRVLVQANPDKSEADCARMAHGVVGRIGFLLREMRSRR